MISKLEQHKDLLKNLSLRSSLLEQFIPTFYYHKEEQNFPVNPDHAIQNIIEVKRDEYIHIQERHGRELTETEQTELDAINNYFWNHETNTFSHDYKKYQNNPLFISLSQKPSQLFIFDEKNYGYQVGEKIDVIGTPPIGHKKYNPSKENAPITASIIPTEDGFFIQYEHLYAISNAIYGIQWLRKILPEWLCKKLNEFGFHYGDSEGVGLHIKLENGKASLQAMQTWAHGRDYAQLVDARDCQFDENGNVCIYVGVGGHPSYAFNFVGRNLPMDLVGGAYKIRAQHVFDVSPDVIEAASELANIDNLRDLQKFNELNPLASLASSIPGSLSSIRRFADSNPLAFNSIKDEMHLKANFEKFNTYQPWLFLVKIKNFLLSLFSKNEKKVAPVSYSIPTLFSQDEADILSFRTANSSSSLSVNSFLSATEDNEPVPITRNTMEDLDAPPQIVCGLTHLNLFAPCQTSTTHPAIGNRSLSL